MLNRYKLKPSKLKSIRFFTSTPFFFAPLLVISRLIGQLVANETKDTFADGMPLYTRKFKCCLRARVPLGLSTGWVYDFKAFIDEYRLGKNRCTRNGLTTQVSCIPVAAMQSQIMMSKCDVH